MENENVITLYPSNWLYNAGVIGLLKVLSFSNKDEYFSLENDGSLMLKKNIFEKELKGNVNVPKTWIYYVDFLTKDENLEDWLEKENNREKNKKFYDEMGDFGYKFIRAFNKLFRLKNSPCRNLVQEGDWKDFLDFIGELPDFGKERIYGKCDVCGENRAIKPNIKSKLENRLFRFDYMHSSSLGPSAGGLPNSFWNQNASLVICPLCVFLILHHHLSLIKLSDNSEIFINAPSFKVMWYLNKYAEEIHSRDKIEGAKEILGMSLIEMASKLYIQLGKWTMMNIEVITKQKVKDNKDKDNIDFFTLPYEIVSILSDRNIANLLYEIGEMNILKLVLDGKFKRILDIGEKIFKITLKPKNEKGKQENDYINSIIKLKKNRKNLIPFSQKLFKLYALIEEKITKGVLI